jgi:hypothetical protein
MRTTATGSSLILRDLGLPPATGAAWNMSVGEILKESSQIQLGVLLPPLAAEETSSQAGPDLDSEGEDSGYGEASGSLGRHINDRESRVAQLGRDVLADAAEAVGRQVCAVVSGVVARIDPVDGTSGLDVGTYHVDSLELSFGVRVTLGGGNAIQAFFTASGEATVGVKLVLRPSVPNLPATSGGQDVADRAAFG